MKSYLDLGQRSIHSILKIRNRRHVLGDKLEQGRDSSDSCCTHMYLYCLHLILGGGETHFLFCFNCAEQTLTHEFMAAFPGERHQR